MVRNIEISNGHARLTKDLIISSKDVENQIKNFSYSGESQEKNPFVENILKMPPMIFTFYGFVFERGKIPSENEMVEAYLNQPFFQVVSETDIKVTSDGKEHIVTKKALVLKFPTQL